MLPEGIMEIIPHPNRLILLISVAAAEELLASRYNQFIFPLDPQHLGLRCRANGGLQLAEEHG